MYNYNYVQLQLCTITIMYIIFRVLVLRFPNSSFEEFFSFVDNVSLETEEL